MKLNTYILTQGTRLEYSFDPGSGVHFLWIASKGDVVESKVAGHVISALRPYREHSYPVKELCSWLAGFNLDGGWCSR